MSKVPSGKICPLCLKRRQQFEKHHVIWRADGGSNDPVNLLPICKTCHAIINNGCLEDLRPRYLACFYHQLGEHGLAFIQKSNALKSKKIPWPKTVEEQYTSLVNTDPEKLDQILKGVGWFMYDKYQEQIMDISFGGPDKPDSCYEEDDQQDKGI
jgi:hypothetical protein